jgi:mevalonate pyrophosphate decarboxylase
MNGPRVFQVMKSTVIRNAEGPTDANAAMSTQQLASPLADAVRALMADETFRFPRSELPNRARSVSASATKTASSGSAPTTQMLRRG